MDESKCPMCGSSFLPIKGMTAAEHLSKSLLSLYREIQDEYAAEIPLPCPRCGDKMNSAHNGNNVSRYNDILICDECGTDEIEREASDKELPISEWHIAKIAFHCVK